MNCRACQWFFDGKCVVEEGHDAPKAFVQKNAVRVTKINGLVAEVLKVEDGLCLCRIAGKVFALPAEFIDIVWREDENICEQDTSEFYYG